MKVTFFILIASTIVNIAGESGRQAPITVCELLENRLKYDGKMVVVRGVLDSYQEGSALVGEDCRAKIVTQGITFPNAINLAYRLDVSSPYFESADFIRDDRKIDEVHREVGSIMRSHPHAKISLTYVGLFETRANLVGVNLAGGPTRVGFGHLGSCPGQLVVQTVKDPRVQSVGKAR